MASALLKVNDENSRTLVPNPESDPLVRGMDPRIRIRIHTKMSWIRNTDVHTLKPRAIWIGIDFGAGPDPAN